MYPRKKQNGHTEIEKRLATGKNLGHICSNQKSNEVREYRKNSDVVVEKVPGGRSREDATCSLKKGKIERTTDP